MLWTSYGRVFYILWTVSAVVECTGVGGEVHCQLPAFNGNAVPAAAAAAAAARADALAAG